MHFSWSESVKDWKNLQKLPAAGSEPWLAGCKLRALPPDLIVSWKTYIALYVKCVDFLKPVFLENGKKAYLITLPYCTFGNDLLLGKVWVQKKFRRVYVPLVRQKVIDAFQIIKLFERRKMYRKLKKINK